MPLAQKCVNRIIRSDELKLKSHFKPTCKSLDKHVLYCVRCRFNMRAEDWEDLSENCSIHSLSKQMGKR